jgi:hypothetical protein
MRTALWTLAILFALTAAATAFEDELLDRLVGEWVMRGEIAGNEIVHDLEVEWILANHYIQIKEVSRGRDQNGNPEYEALVLIGWDDEAEQYACLWLDVTGGEGLTNGVIGRASREGESIPFVFDMGGDAAIHNTFVYEREADRWNWVIDNVREGTPSRFANVSLTRK